MSFGIGFFELLQNIHILKSFKKSKICFKMCFQNARERACPQTILVQIHATLEFVIQSISGHFLKLCTQVCFKYSKYWLYLQSTIKYEFLLYNFVKKCPNNLQNEYKYTTNIQRYSDSWLFVYFRFDVFVFSQSNCFNA